MTVHLDAAAETANPAQSHFFFFNLSRRFVFSLLLNELNKALNAKMILLLRLNMSSSSPGEIASTYGPALKLLINYTRRWSARFFRPVMDTTTHDCNKYVHSGPVGFTHECLCKYRLSYAPLGYTLFCARVRTVFYPCMCGSFMPLVARQSMACRAIACVPLLFFESSACVRCVVFALSLFYCLSSRLQKWAAP